MLELFWARGYRAVTLPEMLATGRISRSSLYNDYGSKAGVFAAVFARYQTRAHARFREYVEHSTSTLETVRRILTDFAQEATQGTSHQGCFILNTAIELGPTRPEIRALIRDNRRETVDILTPLFAAGRARGELSVATKPLHLATLFFVLVNGLQAEARTTRDPEVFEVCAEVFWNLLATEHS